MAQVIVIPARLASSRLPNKVLLDATGWPLIRHVHARCTSVPGVDRVVVAADGEEVAQAVRAFGGEVVVTDPELPSGTDRVAAAIRALGVSGETRVVNVQGDEPRIDPGHVEQLFALLAEPAGGRAPVATLATRRTDPEGFENPHRVKVVRDGLGRALYFSRAPIPFPREAPGEGEESREWLAHVGIYGFQGDALERFVAAGPSPLERREKLEQLRFLELGLKIRVGVVESAAPGIDTPEDYARFVEEVRAHPEA